MCATVCPSQALFFGTREEIEQLRPRSRPVNAFQFGAQTITTKVNMMVPRAAAARQPSIDVTAAMDEGPQGRARELDSADPFAEVETMSLDPAASTRRGREGLAGTASAERYVRDPEQLTLAPDGRPPERAAGVAARLPDRLAAGPLRRAPRLHEVPGADEPRLRRRPAVDRRSRTRGARQRGRPPITRIASLATLPVGAATDVRLPGPRTTAAC